MRRLLLSLLLCFPLTVHALPQVQTLDSDVPVWFIEDRTVPVVSITLTFRHAGSAYDPVAQQGLARLTASLIKEGAVGMSAAAFQTYLNRHAIQLTAGASRDDFTVSLYSLREHADEAVSAAVKLLFEPNLEPAALERVRAQHLSALALMQQSPGYHASRTLAKALYGNHPYGYNRQGTKETLAAITQADVRAHLTAMLQQASLSISAAGAMREEELERWLEPLLERIPDEGEQQERIAPVPPVTNARMVHTAFDNPQSSIRFAAPAIIREDPDFFAAYVLNHILGGNGLTSLLAEELRQERSLTYGAHSWLDHGDASATLQGSVATATATRAEAIEALQETLDEVYVQGVTQEERDQAVAYITGAFPLALDSTSSLAGYLRMMQHYDLGTEYLTQRNAYFEAVTLEDINRVATYMLDPEKRVIAWAGQENAPEGEGDE